MVVVRILVVEAVVALCCLSATQAADKAPDTREADRIVRELCGKGVAMLGESSVHGFGKTMEFKVGLVRRLIDECHYSALFVESGIYDSLNIQKRLKSRRPVSEAMIQAAIGGLWATREVQPLISYLRDKIQNGAVILGGLDDQVLGMRTYAQSEMSSDLVEYLHGDEKVRCAAALQKHMLGQYSDDAPYGPKDRAMILGCLDAIGDSIAKAEAGGGGFREYDEQMLESAKRSFTRDLQWDFSKSEEATRWNNERDRSMYMNFRWLVSRLPAHGKVIVWAATVHLAKDMSGVEGSKRAPLGSYIRRDFKGDSFTLGFSAYSGNYATGRGPRRQLSVAPSTSLESRVFAGRDADTIYLSAKELGKFGPIAARPLSPSFQTARWNEVVDGLVIFREDTAPDFLWR